MIAFKGGRVSSGGRRTGLGDDAGGLVSYLVQGKQRTGTRECLRTVRGHRVPTDNPWIFLDFFETTASQNPRCEMPVYHVGASAAPGEELTDDQWSGVGVGMLRSLGLEEHEALFVVHDGNDPEDEANDEESGQQHLHIVVNRVADDGSVWQPSWDYPKLQMAMRQAERKHGLQAVRSSFELDQARHLPRLSDAAVCRSRAEGTRPLVDRIGSLAREPLRDAESWTDLDARLQPLGLAVRPARRGGGVLVVDAEGHEVSVSKLGRLSGPKLTRRFGIDLRTHRLRNPEPQLEAAEPAADLDAVDTTETILAEAIKTLREEHGIFYDRDIRRQVRWHKESVQLFEQLTEHEELVSLGTRDGEGLWTTQTYRETERQLWASASRLHHDRPRSLPAGAVDQLLARDFSYFGDEQIDAVRHAAEGRRLTLLQGLAGTGKTSMAQAIARSYEAAGYRVVGAALSGRAADILGEETGIESRTLASWDFRWTKGRQALDERTVLLVDEASMVGVGQMQKLLERAEAQGASVILMGDPAQLRPIEPGDAFRGLLRLFPSSELGAIRRQRHEWQRTASKALAVGDPETALRAYDLRGFVSQTETRDEALRAVVETADALPDDESRLVIAFRRRDVAELNERLRERQFAHIPPVLRAEVDIGGRKFAEGDRIKFCRNESRSVRTLGKSEREPEQGVRNGALGTIVSFGDFETTVQLDSGRTVAFSPHEYTELDYGYAVTLHAAQGATVDHSIVYADDRVDLQGIYVAGTRHRDSMQLVYDRESFADLDGLIRSVSREPEPNLVLDVPQTSESPRLDRVVAAIGTRRATWTRKGLEAVVRQVADVEDVLAHPDIIPLEPDLFTTRRQVLAEAKLLEVAEQLSARYSLEVQLDGSSESDSMERWMDGNREPGPMVLVSADRDGAEYLGSRFGQRAVTAWDVVNGPGQLAEGCTVVVDRSQLVDVETMTEVLLRVREAGGAAILTGDPGGHGSVTWGAGAGDAFALLADRHAAEEWQDSLDARPKRQLADWLTNLDRSDRLTTAPNAVERAAKAYLDSSGSPHLVAARPSTVRQLNEVVQEARIDRGEVDRCISLHGGTFGRGDHVVFGAGSDSKQSFLDANGENAEPVAPGTRGKVLATHPRASLVRLEDGRRVQVPAKYQRLDLAYARRLQEVASQRLQGEVHAVLDGGFQLRTARALQNAAAYADLHLHASSKVHPDGLPSIIEQMTREAPRDLAHDQVSAARRYRQLAEAEILPSRAARDQVDRLVSEDLSEESRADILKRLGAPEWSKLYATLDQPTTDSWTDWQTRRQVLAEARSTEVTIRALEDLQDHADRLIEPGARTWLEGATSRQIQRLAPGPLKTLLSLTRAATAIARNPNFLFRLVEPRALRWARTAIRIAGLLDKPKSQERTQERMHQPVQERDGVEWER